MYKILIFQFLNFAILPLLIQFHMKIPFLNDVGLLEGKYEDFNSQWYH